MESIDVADLEAIGRQLGRRPRGVTGIPVRCSYGFPQVIRVHPIVEGRPFPTLYWLTCPHLVKAIDRLEAEGWISRLEQKLAVDDALCGKLVRAHDRYVDDRMRQTADRDVKTPGRPEFAASLRDRGIGGIADRRWLKCLHLHVAHALADDNPIGRIVLGRIGPKECAAAGPCTTRDSTQ